MAESVSISRDDIITIISQIDKVDLMQKLLTMALDEFGVEVMDKVLVAITYHLNSKQVSAKHLRLSKQSQNIYTIPEFHSIRNMWPWGHTDQTGYSNIQKPDATYKLTVNDNVMFLFAEIDGTNKDKEPQRTAQKLWQDVTFGRVRDNKMSVATVRMNLMSMRRDNSSVENTEASLSGARKAPLRTSEVYKWMVEIIQSCVYVVAHWIGHNCRAEQKASSPWSKTVSVDYRHVYDMHFFVGAFQTNFSSFCSSGNPIPENKRLDATNALTKQQVLDPDGILRTIAKRNVKAASDSKYRPTAPHEDIIKDLGQDGVTWDDVCLMIHTPTLVHHGEIDTQGAPIHYMFVQRVLQKEIDTAVVRASSANTTAITSFFAKIEGMWYLQDMIHFLRRAQSQWGENFDEKLKYVLDGNGKQKAVPQALKIYLPDSWNNVEEDFGGAKAYQRFNVYDSILAPFVAEQENMYHSLIDGLSEKPEPSTEYINNMKDILNKMKEKFNRHQINPPSRKQEMHQKLVPGSNLKTRIVMDYASPAAQESYPLDPQLVITLTDFNSDYMECFCRMVQCCTYLSLHQLAENYLQGLQVQEVDRFLSAFSVGVQSEIRYMLRTIGSQHAKIMSNTEIFIPTSRLHEKVPIHARVRGGYTFGSDTKDKKVVISMRIYPREKSDWKKVEKFNDWWRNEMLVYNQDFKVMEMNLDPGEGFKFQNAARAKLWLQQDYLKGPGQEPQLSFKSPVVMYDQMQKEEFPLKSLSYITVFGKVLSQPCQIHTNISTYLSEVRELFSYKKDDFETCMLWICLQIVTCGMKSSTGPCKESWLLGGQEALKPYLQDFQAAAALVFYTTTEAFPNFENKAPDYELVQMIEETRDKPDIMLKVKNYLWPQVQPQQQIIECFGGEEAIKEARQTQRRNSRDILKNIMHVMEHVIRTSIKYYLMQQCLAFSWTKHVKLTDKNLQLWLKETMFLHDDESWLDFFDSFACLRDYGLVAWQMQPSKAREHHTKKTIWEQKPYEEVLEDTQELTYYLYSNPQEAFEDEEDRIWSHLYQYACLQHKSFEGNHELAYEEIKKSYIELEARQLCYMKEDAASEHSLKYTRQASAATHLKLSKAEADAQGPKKCPFYQTLQREGHTEFRKDCKLCQQLDQAEIECMKLHFTEEEEMTKAIKVAWQWKYMSMSCIRKILPQLRLYTALVKAATLLNKKEDWDKWEKELKHLGNDLLFETILQDKGWIDDKSRPYPDLPNF